MITRFISTLQKQVLTVFLATALIFSGIASSTVGLAAAGTGTKEQISDSVQDQLLSRQLTVNDSGLVRSYLTDQNGDRYMEDTDENRSDAITKFKKSSSLPSTYDLRNLGLTTSIKNQGQSGCCWAFGALKSIESNAILKGLSSSVESTDYSENHLTWFSYSPVKTSSDPLYKDGMSINGMNSSNTEPYDNGGSATLALFTLAKWTGPIAENQAPFSADSNTSLQTMASNMATTGESLRNSADLHLQNANSYDETNAGTNYYYNNSNAVSDMKQAIIENGAMDIALYYNSSALNTTSSGEVSYYQTSYSGSNAVTKANHCVTIVGWDDNFSRNKFNSSPSGDGAWLIANSYGSNWGQEGYFWLSYYDQSICDCYTFDMEASNNYDNILQYDGFGWGQALYSSSDNVRAGNIFKSSSASPQKISAVSFYTVTDNQPYKVHIYRNVSTSATDPTGGVLIDTCTTSGTASKNGYHTVTLANPVSVNAGERFSVVVTYIQSGSKRAYVPFEGTSESASTYSLNYSSSTGQSFLFYDWYNSKKATWIDSSTLGYNNVCVKAFTKNTTVSSDLPTYTNPPSTGIGTPGNGTSSTLKLSKTKIRLGKGESVKPFSNSSYTYSSKNTGIATVNSSGKITAKSTGSTKITVSSANASSTLRVTVKKAPKKITIQPSKKKNTKKGKSFKLKTKLSSGSASYKLTYFSSNKKVVTVSKTGKVKAKKAGTATIRVRTFNKKTARLTVVVKK